MWGYLFFVSMQRDLRSFCKASRILAALPSLDMATEFMYYFQNFRFSPDLVFSSPLCCLMFFFFSIFISFLFFLPHLPRVQCLVCEKVEGREKQFLTWCAKQRALFTLFNSPSMIMSSFYPLLTLGKVLCLSSLWKHFLHNRKNITIYSNHIYKNAWVYQMTRTFF